MISSLYMKEYNLTFVVLLPLLSDGGGAEGLLVHPVGVVVRPPAAPALPVLVAPPVVAVVTGVAEPHVLPLKLRTPRTSVLLLLVQLHLLLQT